MESLGISGRIMKRFFKK